MGKVYGWRETRPEDMQIPVSNEEDSDVSNVRSFTFGKLVKFVAISAVVCVIALLFDSGIPIGIALGVVIYRWIRRMYRD